MDIRKEIDKAEEALKELDDLLRGLCLVNPESNLVFNIRRSVVRIEEDFYQLRKFKNENS